MPAELCPSWLRPRRIAPRRRRFSVAPLNPNPANEQSRGSGRAGRVPIFGGHMANRLIVLRLLRRRYLPLSPIWAKHKWSAIADVKIAAPGSRSVGNSSHATQLTPASRTPLGCYAPRPFTPDLRPVGLVTDTYIDSPEVDRSRQRDRSQLQRCGCVGTVRRQQSWGHCRQDAKTSGPAL